MMLKEVLLLARQKGTPSLIVREGNTYSLTEFDESAAFVYLGGDTLPIPVNSRENMNLTNILTELFTGKLTRIIGAKIRRRA